MEKEKKTNETEDKTTIYEVSYVLLPSLAIEQVPAKATSIKEMIQKAGGAVISDENPVLIDLAYPMTKVVSTIRHKATTGYFGWIKFDMSVDGISTVKKSLDSNDEILRYLIIKTVRENTLLNGKMMLKKEDKMKREDEMDGEVRPEESASPEEIDKSIDDLVVA
ncbi:MAG: 30S ribosomal protein S6 [Patescibacteria group bacterium]